MGNSRSTASETRLDVEGRRAGPQRSTNADSNRMKTFVSYVGSHTSSSQVRHRVTSFASTKHTKQPAASPEDLTCHVMPWRRCRPSETIIIVHVSRIGDNGGAEPAEAQGGGRWSRWGNGGRTIAAGSERGVCGSSVNPIRQHSPNTGRFLRCQLWPPSAHAIYDT